MKKIMLTTVAALGLTLANAQTNNTTVTTQSATSKVSNKPTTEVRAERSAMNMKGMLNLNEDQYKQMYDAKLVVYTKMHDLSMKYRMDEKNDERKSQMSNIHAEYMKSLKKTLTSDQLATWQKAANERYERWKAAVTAQPNAAANIDEEEQKMRMDME